MRGQKWKRNRGRSSIRLFALIFNMYSLCCCPHHNIKCWLKAFVKWGMGSSSSGGEGETDADAAKVAPWGSAAHCRRQALARAPCWWRWRAGAGLAVGEVDVVVDGGGDGGDSSTSLMDDLPPLTRWSRWCSRHPPPILKISGGFSGTPLSFFAQISEQKKTSWAHKCPSVLFNSPVQTNIERGHFESSAEGI